MKEIIKKLFKVLLFLLLTTCINAQSSWTQEETQLINEYGLDSNDHRGILIKIDENSNNTLISSIVGFFNSQEKSDITTIYVSRFYENQLFLNQIFDLHQLVKLYLFESK